MPVNLYQLDDVENYEEALAVLDRFVEELVAEFVTSSEGNNYMQAYPVAAEYVGLWIEGLLCFSYFSESVTLPHMTVEGIDTIVTQIFPQQISSIDPTAVDCAIPELIAFWRFLKREYQLTHAQKMIEFLQQIEPKFNLIMNDLNNFKVAKSCPIADLVEETKRFRQPNNFTPEFRQDYKSAVEGQSNVLENIDNLVGDLGIKGSKILSHGEQIALTNELRELATELLTAFPEEVPTAKEFQQQLEATVIPMLSTSRSRSLPSRNYRTKAAAVYSNQSRNDTTGFSDFARFYWRVGSSRGKQAAFYFHEVSSAVKSAAIRTNGDRSSASAAEVLSDD